MMKIKTKGERAFGVFNIIFLALLAFITLYPFVYIISVSLSSAMYVNMGEVWFLPKGFTLASYQKALARSGLVVAYLNSFYYMIVGTAISMVLTVFGAYPLSKKRLYGKKIMNLLVVFTMWFGAGMVPMYLNYKSLGLLDTRLAILLSVSAYNFILMRTYFMSIPDALEEASKIDGASDFQVLVKVYLPLSLPSIATVSLFYAIGQWNSYFWPMILLRDESKIPLQVLLKKFVVDMTSRLDELEYGVDATNMSEDGIIYSTMVLAIVPMLIIYPFAQKYFVKGVMVGSVKG